MDDRERSDSRLDGIIATLLGLAAVLVAVTGYQGALRDGDSIKSFNEGIRSINDANGFYNEATSVYNRDSSLFLEFAKASQEDNAELAEYVKTTLMDETLATATDEWIEDESGEVLTPLDAPSYSVPQQDEADRLTAETDRQFAEAVRLDNEGDDYGLVGVIVASSLFFLGIAGVMSSRRIKLAGTTLGAITLAVSFGLWLTV